VKERQVLAQLSAQSAQLANMHSAEEVAAVEGRLSEAAAAQKAAKAEITRLKQYVKVSVPSLLLPHPVCTLLCDCCVLYLMLGSDLCVIAYKHKMRTDIKSSIIS
jgi:hypothetical protein